MATQCFNRNLGGAVSGKTDRKVDTYKWNKCIVGLKRMHYNMEKIHFT